MTLARPVSWIAGLAFALLGPAALAAEPAAPPKGDVAAIAN